MELCSGGELYYKMLERKVLSERRSAKIIKQILSAIYYCHANNIIHRYFKCKSFSKYIEILNLKISSSKMNL